MSSSQVLVVDDDCQDRGVLAGILSKEGAEVSEAGDGPKCLAMLERKSYQVLFAKLRMAKMDGLTIVRQAMQLHPELRSVLLAGQGSLDSCIEAMRLGVCDFVVKPFTVETIRRSLARALDNRGQNCAANADHAETPKSAQAAPRAVQPDPRLLGQSVGMRGVWLFVAKVAPTDAPILIRGEPGVGKELVAEMIHSRSRRSAGSFLRVPCQGIREADAEDALFGPDHSGVDDETRRAGMLHAAQGGTLFLADVECMPLWAQVRLFNAFHRRWADGGDGLRSAGRNVRLMASTSCDLEGLVDDGRFFAGLYYLLNVAAVRVPPLRERREDIKGLAEHFLRETLAEQDLGARAIPWSFTPEAWECLLNHDWPGNLLELASVVAHAVALADNEKIDRGAIACGPSKRVDRNCDTISVPLAGNLREIERHIIEEVIRRCRGNKAAAARALGLHRKTLYRLWKE